MADRGERVEGRLAGVRGVQLRWQGVLPPEEPRGVVLLSHGLGEHGGRYGHVEDALVPEGWAVYALDHRGHGRSGGRRAHLDHYSDWLADFDAFRHLVVSRHGGAPLFVLGHSMGGQIALSYALEHGAGLAGIVLSSPALASETATGPARRVLQVLATVLPTARIIGLDTTKISKDPAVVAAYHADPLVHHGKPTLGVMGALASRFGVLQERARGLDLPLLLQYAGKDALVDPAGSDLLAATSGSSDLTVRRYDELWHEIYNEPERDLPLADLREWLATRGRVPPS